MVILFPAGMAGACPGDWTMPPDRKRLRRYGANLALVAGSLLLTGLVLEAATRRYEARLVENVAPFMGRPPANDMALGSLKLDHPGVEINSTWDAEGNSRLHVRSADRGLIYELRPDTSLLDGLIQTNAEGFRDTEFSTEKEPDVRRIIVVGDSITFGWRLPVDQVYPKVLEGMLNAEKAGGCRYEVYNMGVGGYDAGQELELVRAKVLKYRPDVLVVGYCDNDNLRGMDGGLWWHFWRGPSAFLSLVRLKSMLVMEKLRGKDLVQTSYESLAVWSKQTGVPVVVVVFPIGPDPQRQYRKIFADNRARLFTSLGFRVVYPEEAFEKAGLENVFYPDDSLHPNGTGHRMVAEMLDHCLVENKLLAPCR